MRYDLCLPWYWEYDDIFVEMVERACIEQGISLWQIKPDNLLESITALYKGTTTFKTLLDRGQGELVFKPISCWAQEHSAKRINPCELSAWSEDKTTMHYLRHSLSNPSFQKSTWRRWVKILSSSLPMVAAERASLSARQAWIKFYGRAWNFPSKSI